MIDHINRNKNCHIITVEDPIEYLHTHKQSMVNQREIGADVDSFAGYKDWCVEKLGIPAFTIENGANEWGVPVPIEHFDEIYRCSRDITALVARELNR